MIRVTYYSGEGARSLRNKGLAKMSDVPDDYTGPTSRSVRSMR